MADLGIGDAASYINRAQPQNTSPITRGLAMANQNAMRQMYRDAQKAEKKNRNDERLNAFIRKTGTGSIKDPELRKQATNLAYSKIEELYAADEKKDFRGRAELENQIVNDIHDLELKDLQIQKAGTVKHPALQPAKELIVGYSRGKVGAEEIEKWNDENPTMPIQAGADGTIELPDIKEVNPATPAKEIVQKYLALGNHVQRDANGKITDVRDLDNVEKEYAINDLIKEPGVVGNAHLDKSFKKGWKEYYDKKSGKWGLDPDAIDHEKHDLFSKYERIFLKENYIDPIATIVRGYYGAKDDAKNDTGWWKGFSKDFTVTETGKGDNASFATKVNTKTGKPPVVEYGNEIFDLSLGRFKYKNGVPVIETVQNIQGKNIPGDDLILTDQNILDAVATAYGAPSSDLFYEGVVKYLDKLKGQKAPKTATASTVIPKGKVR